MACFTPTLATSMTNESTMKMAQSFSSTALILPTLKITALPSTTALALPSAFLPSCVARQAVYPRVSMIWNGFLCKRSLKRFPHSFCVILSRIIPKHFSLTNPTHQRFRFPFCLVELALGFIVFTGSVAHDCVRISAASKKTSISKTAAYVIPNFRS